MTSIKLEKLDYWNQFQGDFEVRSSAKLNLNFQMCNVMSLEIYI